MKRVLIYMDRKQLKPTGGPIGYNYNLMSELDKSENLNIEFLNGTSDDIQRAKDFIANIKSEFVKKIIITLKHTFKYWRLLYGKTHTAPLDLNKYAVIHFHSTYDMFLVRDSLKSYKGTVILTSHSPTLLSRETYDGTKMIEKVMFPWFFGRLEEMDRFAFTRADKIIFPCREAIEPYTHCWKDFEQKFESKFLFLPTGINKCMPKLSRERIREKYNIPMDAFLICYVGRHNQIKGYDRLIEIGKKEIKKPNTYIIVAGAQGPIFAPKEERWVEVGWTNDPHSIIGAADVFLLPNRETYFDLILLEVLSIGMPIVASYTGGNKYFKKYETKSIQLFETEDECERKIDVVRNMNQDERQLCGKRNKEIFDEYFTCKMFCDNYVKIIENILEEKLTYRSKEDN